MNPADALPKDYGMYYDGCWMRHSKHGVGRVNVIGGDLYLQTPGRANPLHVSPQYLEVWWPRARAANMESLSKAVYIGRKAARNMRKSAVSRDHYYVKWGGAMGMDVMLLLVNEQDYPSLEKASDMLANGWESVAVSRDIILTKDEDEGMLMVVFRGIEAGRLQVIRGHGAFEPLFSGCPWTRPIVQQLEL